MKASGQLPANDDGEGHRETTVPGTLINLPDTDLGEYPLRLQSQGIADNHEGVIGFPANRNLVRYRLYRGEIRSGGEGIPD